MDELRCEAGHICTTQDRWHCASLALWRRRNGEMPWGMDEEPGTLLRWLATLTEEEHPLLAECAYDNLVSGFWEGVVPLDRGWEDIPLTEQEASWRAVAQDFADRYRAGERRLTEGLVKYALTDLAQELAWLREWCPEV